MKTVNMPREPLTIERLECALAAVAYMLILDGPVLAPLLSQTP